MAKSADLNTAKKALLSQAKNEEWLMSIGIGLVDAVPGLIVSVKLRATAQAQKLLAAARVSVPVRIREIGPVRKRAAEGSARIPRSTGRRSTH